VGGVIFLNKKVLALLIVGVIIVGAYVSYYAYATMVLMPADREVFQEELNSIKNSTVPESDIKELEQIADQIENGVSLTVIPASERKAYAQELANDPAISSINTTITEVKNNITTNEEIASRYDLLLKGDVADNIRAVYNQEIVTMMEELYQVVQKLPSDLEKGDNNAVADDFRQIANLSREYNQFVAEAEPRLQEIVNSLEG
jgi:exonuclease VII small subunit